MPWWKFDRKNDFLRGYHIEFGGGRDCRVWAEVDDFAPRGRLRRITQATMPQPVRHTYRFCRPRRMIPNENSYCENRSNTVDQWGHSGIAVSLAMEVTTRSGWRRNAGNLPTIVEPRAATFISKAKPMARIRTVSPTAASLFTSCVPLAMGK